MNPEELIARAGEVRENACADYSHYKVGAALVASSGKVYTGWRCGRPFPRAKGNSRKLRW
jgi:cytidine deaminase